MQLLGEVTITRTMVRFTLPAPMIPLAPREQKTCNVAGVPHSRVTTSTGVHDDGRAGSFTLIMDPNATASNEHQPITNMSKHNLLLNFENASAATGKRIHAGTESAYS
jgi:hypothetical protein